MLGINVVAYFTMGLDKRNAANHGRRTPEKTLFSLAVIGGSIGIYGGMRFFRHKTKHASFQFGIPAIIFVQIIVVILLFLKTP